MSQQLSYQQVLVAPGGARLLFHQRRHYIFLFLSYKLNHLYLLLRCHGELE